MEATQSTIACQHSQKPQTQFGRLRKWYVLTPFRSLSFSPHFHSVFDYNQLTQTQPSRRVMPCMAGLPDGTYFITGGGQHGVAGFGLGGAPNYNALLYDPTKPVNQRFSVMANTTVARLYHSEAIVLLDGRVMISGSDPTGNYQSDPNSWPEEYRVEVFTPPYLLNGAARPTFTVSSKDWVYGANVAFTSSVGGVKVSLLGSVSSTHGNSMGQRTLFPAVSCTGTSCTVCLIFPSSPVSSTIGGVGVCLGIKLTKWIGYRTTERTYCTTRVVHDVCAQRRYTIRWCIRAYWRRSC